MNELFIFNTLQLTDLARILRNAGEIGWGGKIAEMFLDTTYDDGNLYRADIVIYLNEVLSEG